MSALLMAGASVLSGLFGASSARRAANAQAEAAEMGIEEQRRQFDLSRQDLEPWRQTGTNALAALNYELGLGPMPGTMNGLNSMQIQEVAAQPGLWEVSAGNFGAYAPSTQLYSSEEAAQAAAQALQMSRSGDGEGAAPMPSVSQVGGGGGGFSVNGQMFDSRDAAQAYIDGQGGGTQYRGFQETPGYQYQLEQGQNALAASAAARGIRMSGAAMRSAQAHGQGMANQEYGNYLNRLSGLSGTGQTATNTTASLGANMANNISNAYGAMGDARASGYQGVNNALQGTMGNMFSIYGMNQAGYFDK